ncbi:hypothetical protein AOQ84DRAFT_375512 [Glonium stellatum]|uniref:Cryptic loci regulator 2 N-terminal domain-containing protein n=1 Tax=Glonium stellatum TaxID=574774 RepID=A0A8E2F4H3_9PEZI|nr:hypothetical protein AOQ84DRAFT_375512 [Glonium stellatum]
MSAGTVVVPIRPGSDGDATHQPDRSTHTLVDPPTLYLEKIASLWMESRGEALPGVRYILDKLPAGYTLYQKSRIGTPKHIDRWLFGHPVHKYFDSPNRFFPHFRHLMENGGDNIGCICTVCQTKGGVRIPSITTGAIVKQRGRPKLIGPDADATHVDDEGTPDVYRNLIDKLKRTGSLDEPIKESMSLDWRAERKLLPAILTKISNQPAWVPRIAEIVLFVRKIGTGEEICRDNRSGEYKIYNHNMQKFTGFPCWEAGVIGQPAAEAVSIKDLVVETGKKFQVNYSGFRVEPLPNPNDNNKALSKQYKYVPLHHTRPFVFWREFLNHVPEDEWHPTIKHAFTVMSSFSLLEKYKFKGKWPSASISCRGIFIGSELILVGDVVRLVPTLENSPCTDVLQISSIKLKLSNLNKANDNDYDEGHPYNSAVHIIGRAFTLDPSRSASGGGLPVNNKTDSHLPSSIDGYEEWHPRHSLEKEMVIPFSRVLGRCFEAEAMILWFPQIQSPKSSNNLSPNLNEGLSGIYHARKYSSQHDKRISNGKCWFWGDSRTDALDLETLNGQEVGRYDTSRDPNKWRKFIKIIEGVANTEEKVALERSTLAQKPLRGYLASNNLVQSAFQNIDSEIEDMTTTRESSVVPRKRGRTVATNSESESVRFIRDGEADEIVEGFTEGNSFPGAVRRDDNDVEDIADGGQKRQRAVIVID